MAKTPMSRVVGHLRRVAHLQEADRLIGAGGTIGLGPTYGEVQVKGLTVEQAEISILRQLRQMLREPKVSVTRYDDLLQPGLRIFIDVSGTPPNDPIKGVYLLEVDGTVGLGPVYGRVQVKGMTVEQAEVAIHRHLLKTLRAPKVFVLRYDAVIHGPGQDSTLVRRIQSLEEEVRELRTAIEKLQK